MPKKTNKLGNRKKVLKLKKLSFRTTIRLMIVVAVIVFLVGGWLWWSRVATNPNRVLNDMLSSSLQTTSVDKTVTSMGETQTIRLSYSPGPFARIVDDKVQSGPGGDNKMRLEALGTQNADYYRFTNIVTNGKVPTGADKILGVWARQKPNELTGSSAQVLTQAKMSSAILFANLNNQDSQKILDTIKTNNVYKIDNSKKELIEGRPAVTLEVTIKQKNLVTLINTYQEVLGQKDANRIDPESYEKAPDIKLNISIDVISHRLLAINYEGNFRTETYSGYGLMEPATIPDQPISTDELQMRMQQLIQQEQQQPTKKS